MLQARTKLTDLGFADLNEELSCYTPSNLESPLSRPLESRYGPAPRQKYFVTGNFEGKLAPLQDWQSLMDLSFVRNKALRNENMGILSKH